MGLRSIEVSEDEATRLGTNGLPVSPDVYVADPAFHFIGDAEARHGIDGGNRRRINDRNRRFGPVGRILARWNIFRGPDRTFAHPLNLGRRMFFHVF